MSSLKTVAFIILIVAQKIVRLNLDNWPECTHVQNIYSYCLAHFFYKSISGWLFCKMYTKQSFSLVFTSGWAPHWAQYAYITPCSVQIYGCFFIHICIMQTLRLIQYKLFSIHGCCAFVRSSSSWPGGRNLRQQVSIERRLCKHSFLWQPLQNPTLCSSTIKKFVCPILPWLMLEYINVFEDCDSKFCAWIVYGVKRNIFLCWFCWKWQKILRQNKLIHFITVLYNYKA